MKDTLPYERLSKGELYIYISIHNLKKLPIRQEKDICKSSPWISEEV